MPIIILQNINRYGSLIIPNQTSSQISSVFERRKFGALSCHLILPGWLFSIAGAVSNGLGLSKFIIQNNNYLLHCFYWVICREREMVVKIVLQHTCI